MKLKPCPHCGGEAKLYENWGWNKSYDVKCSKCGIGNSGFVSQEVAIKAWNMHYEPPNEPLTLDELRQMDGEPVFVCGAMPCKIFHDDFWGIVDAGAERIVSHNNTVGFSDVAEYAVYRRRPEEETT